MNKTKETFIIGFALFSGFFGAGNLILPPFLGFNAGSDWWFVAIGFVISATVIPLLAILAHARLQGTMLDFGNKVSPLFSLVFSLLVYIISISLPVPRTASVAHEIAIRPFFGTSPLLTSSIYFLLVFIFVMNRNNVLNILGKILTPLIVFILVAIIGVGIYSAPVEMNPSLYDAPIANGILEGYQTFDAIGGLLMGGILVITLNIKGYTSFVAKKRIIAKAGIIAASGLFLIYGGLIAIGAFYNTQFDSTITRTELLSGLSIKTLGNIGTLFLSVLVALACFTTAVTIIVGTADFFKGLFKESQLAYTITAVISSVLGIIIGQFDVHYIINVALPVLMFIYPLTIVLIFLNLFPEKYASKTVFRIVVLVTFIFSIPDFMQFLIPEDKLQNIQSIIPLSTYNLGWLLPALVVFVLVNLVKIKKSFSEVS
jgi:branched-chain amino acid:cation transporter, LIVCS family